MTQEPGAGSADDVKIALLQHIYGDDPEASAASLAQRVADDQHCLSYLMQLYDDTCALHDRARSKMAEAGQGLAALERIDMLLDDVMILLAHRDGGGGGDEVEAGGERAVSMGEGERA